MGANTSVQLSEDELNRLTEETRFNRKQLNRLYSRFVHLDKSNNGYLSREDLLRIPELAINPLCDRIVNSFFSTDPDELNFRDFVHVLARFRPNKTETEADNVNSRESKLRFIFNMYDLNGDDVITQEELSSVLHMMVGSNISEEKISAIAMRTVSEVDEDGDGKISFNEFVTAMNRVDIEQKMSIKFLN